MNVVVEPGALRSLLAQLAGDLDAQRRFITDFVGLWVPRSQRLANALAAPDPGDAHVVLLSIHSSSRLLGAARLEDEATVMLDLLADGDLDGCRDGLAEFDAVGRLTCAELNRHLGL